MSQASRVSRIGHRSRALLFAHVVSMALAGAGLLGLAGSAWAHTTLISTEPAGGTKLESAPAEMTLTFSEAILPRFLTVRLSIDDGVPQELPARVDGAVVTAYVPEGTGAVRPAESRWRVDYRVVAADGHAVTGGVEFNVATSPAGPRLSPTATASATPSQSSSDLVSSEHRRDGSVAPVPWLLLGSLAALVLVSAAARGVTRRRR